MQAQLHGSAFGRRFGADSAPSFVARSLNRTEIAVTYLEQRTPAFELFDPQPVADASLVSMTRRRRTRAGLRQALRLTDSRDAPKNEEARIARVWRPDHAAGS